MKRYRIGVLCPSEIAFRRFLPSLKNVGEFEFAGVATATQDEWFGEGFQVEDIHSYLDKEKEKTKLFIDTFGGKIYEGYKSIILSPDIDAIYIPLPPALHYKWSRMVLENGKNAYVEKPFTTNLEDTRTLLSIAQNNRLAVHENYMFIFHNQIKEIERIIDSGEIGKVRLYRISFGFPKRSANDFRYSKALGGGALLDAGGYCLKYAGYLLGESAHLVCANSFFESEYDVDIFGTATMANDEGVVAQLSFGMDNDYKCELEAWGSKGTLNTKRILTAPDGFQPDLTIKHNQDYSTIPLPSDNAFEKSIHRFYQCITDDDTRIENYSIIENQSSLVSDFLRMTNND